MNAWELRLHRVHLPVTDDIQGAVLAPGMVCGLCREDVSFGLLLRYRYLSIPQTEWLVVGKTCAQRGGEPERWLQALRRRQYYDTEEAYRLEARVRRGDRTLFRAVALLQQLGDRSKFVAAMRQRMLERRPWQGRQRATLQQIVERWGGLSGLLRQRNLAFRIRWLLAAHRAWLSTSQITGPWLSLEDQRTLESLQRAVPYGLTPAQQRLVLALNARYQSLREQYTVYLMTHVWMPEEAP